MTRRKYLWMTANGVYNTVDRALTDHWLLRHVQGETTLGVFAGQTFSKFICFDVDTSELTESRHITYRLVDTLMHEYNIPSKYIHVSYSGHKGYHVEIFFNHVLEVTKLQQFYYDVLATMNEEQHVIEFRPTFGQGVKLPLSFHRKTGRKCHYCDRATLEAVDDEYILTIEPMDLDEFNLLVFEDGDQVFTLPEQVATQYEQVRDRINIDNKARDELESEMIQILERNKLKFKGSRHRVTLFLSMFLYSQGWEKEDAEARILEVMDTTWRTARGFIAATTTWKTVKTEVQKAVRYTYERGYVLGSGKKEITITRDELIKCMTPEKMHHKELLFSMLIHSKKHAGREGTFYMPYSTMTQMGNTKNRTRLVKYVRDLEHMDYIEVLRRNELDRERTRELGRCISKPNVYKVLVESEDSVSLTLHTDKEIDFFKVVSQLLEETEAKKMFTKTQFYTKLSEHYKNKIG